MNVYILVTLTHITHPVLLKLQLKEDELRDAVILVFANKQDMPNAMTAAELTNALNLNNMRNRRVSTTRQVNLTHK